MNGTHSMKLSKANTGLKAALHQYTRQTTSTIGIPARHSAMEMDLLRTGVLLTSSYTKAFKKLQDRRMKISKDTQVR